MNFKNVVNRLGILKNELLIFTVMATIILNGSAIPLEHGTSSFQKIGGMIMHLSTIPIFLFFGAFYCYAFLRLPSSAQELTFTMHAKELVTETKRRAPKNPRTSP